LTLENKLLAKKPETPQTPNKYFFQALDQTLQTAKMNLKKTVKLTSFQKPQYHDCNPLQSSSIFLSVPSPVSRNLARQTSRDLHLDSFVMVLTAGFYCDSRVHNVRKVRVVKYIVIYGQTKAADQKYCHNQKWRRKLKETSFRTRGFGDNLRMIFGRDIVERMTWI